MQLTLVRALGFLRLFKKSGLSSDVVFGRVSGGMFKDFSMSAVVAGFITALVGFTSSVAVIFQAARSLSATPEQTGSWLLALGATMAVGSIVLSLSLRQPILIAWSTPGAAVIAAAGAGFSGVFEKMMNRIPLPLASALLAGVLSKFALDAVAATPVNPVLVLSMGAAYVLGRSFWPRANVPVILLLGVVIAYFQGRLHPGSVPWRLTMPMWVHPEFRLGSIIGVGVFYGLIGIFGGAIVSLFEAFPHELVLVVAGLALLGTIESGLMAAVEGERYRESSVLAFFVVLSGVTFGGIGSAFLGVVVGLVVLGVRKLASREPGDSRS